MKTNLGNPKYDKEGRPIKNKNLYSINYRYIISIFIVLFIFASYAGSADIEQIVVFLLTILVFYSVYNFYFKLDLSKFGSFNNDLYKIKNDKKEDIIEKYSLNDYDKDEIERAEKMIEEFNK